MTDRPILFSAAMVRAQIEGRKTQTRRILKPQPAPFQIEGEGEAPVTLMHLQGEPLPRVTIGRVITAQQVRFAVGDRLWVREAWRAQEVFDKLSPVAIGEQFAAEHGAPWCPVFYEANRRCDGSSVEMWQQSPPGRLRASMHMPRWASRLTWTVTDVRLQRLQIISAADAAAEGLIKLPATGRYVVARGDQYFGAAEFDPRLTYRRLWNEINGDGAWDANPWVVAITGTVEQRNIDA